MFGYCVCEFFIIVVGVGFDFDEYYCVGGSVVGDYV